MPTLETDLEDIIPLAIVKGNELYIWLYSEDNTLDVLRQLGKYAANPELSFTWYDAAVCSQAIREVYTDGQNRRLRSDRFAQLRAGEAGD